MNLNNVDFSGRMQDARDNAARERHRGRTVSRPHFAKPEPMEDTPENRLRAELADLRGELRERDNTIAVLQSGGNPDDTIIDHGAEFDRLVAATKAQRRGLPSPPPLPPPSHATPVRTRDSQAMTREQYLTALEKLGLTRASKRTSAAFGVTLRQCQSYASGNANVPPTLAKLIGMYLEHGMPEDDR